MFILKTTIEPEICLKQIENIKENILSNGGEIETIDDMGSRQLAYEINKNKRGHYVVIYFKAPTSSIKELERLNTINENILRFIFIKFDTNKEIANWDNMVALCKKKKTEQQNETNEETNTKNETKVEKSTPEDETNTKNETKVEKSTPEDETNTKNETKVEKSTPEDETNTEYKTKIEKSTPEDEDI